MLWGSVPSYTHHSGFEKYIIAYILLAITSRIIEGKGRTKKGFLQVHLAMPLTYGSQQHA